jgi:hypothetical protein
MPIAPDGPLAKGEGMHPPNRSQQTTETNHPFPYQASSTPSATPSAAA